MLTDLLILSLAAWYAAYVLVNEDGLFGVLAALRQMVPSHTPLRCIVCTSLWTALGCWALMQTPLEWLVIVLAAAGGALILHRWSGWSYTG